MYKIAWLLWGHYGFDEYYNGFKKCKGKKEKNEKAICADASVCEFSTRFVPDAGRHSKGEEGIFSLGGT